MAFGCLRRIRLYSLRIPIRCLHAVLSAHCTIPYSRPHTAMARRMNGGGPCPAGPGMLVCLGARKGRQAKGDCFHVSAYVRRYTVPYLRVMKALPPHRRDASRDASRDGPEMTSRWTRADLEMDPR